MNRKSIKPDVSVIVPVYNVEKYLLRCLESISNQTYENIEIIAVNDGSTDSSLTILISYSINEPRLKIITQDNRGLSGARNAGIDASRAEHIVFVDSDDYIEKDMIFDMFHKLQQHKVGVVLGRYETIIQGKGGCLSNNLSKLSSKEQFISALLRHEITPIVCGNMYKKSVMEKCGHFRHGVKYEDVEYSTKIFLNAEDILYLDKKYYNWSMDNEHSISKQVDSVNFFDGVKALSSAYAYLEANSVIAIHQKDFGVGASKFLTWLLSRLDNIRDDAYKVSIVSALIELVSHSNFFYSISKHNFINIMLILRRNGFNTDRYLSEAGFSSGYITAFNKSSLSRIGLMEICLDILRRSNVSCVYIYGAGEIGISVIPQIEKSNILIKGIIDRSERDVLVSGKTYQSVSLDNTDFRNGDSVIISSIAFSEEIREGIEKKAKMANICVNVIDFISI